MTLPKPGVYVIAVSGGVDSVALLHRLQQEPGLKLTVAHFDHGIREDSVADRQFVAQLAAEYGLPYIYDEGRLGQTASEAAARAARYAFLQKVATASNAQAIITAHHQDDVMETAIINLLRGTGRKGLTALGNRQGVERPITHIPKVDLIAYAKDQGLTWREDSTNKDEAYLRNYVRQRLLARFDQDARQKLITILEHVRRANHELDKLLDDELDKHTIDGVIDRNWFTQLPHDVAREIMAAWLRMHGVRGFDRKTLERLVVAAKVAHPGSQFDVLLGVKMRTGIDNLALAGHER